MVEISAYTAVGRCIYCGSCGDAGELSDEHVVPFSLGGEAVLPKASCEVCAKVTSAFEGRCASTMYGSFRIRQNVQTRRPKKRATELPAIATMNGNQRTVMMRLPGVVATLPLVHFLPPGLMRQPPVREIGWTGATLEVKTDSPRDYGPWNEHGADSYEFMQTFDVDSLARLLAKIAHCIAVGSLGVDTFDHWLPPYILGQDPHLSFLVGGAKEALEPEHVLHQIKYEVWPRQNDHLVTVKIRLFAQFGGPHALVIVGTTTQGRLDARAPEFRKDG